MLLVTDPAKARELARQAHHGAPTRLLDWSDGALIALHFAVRNTADDEHDAIVYVLEPDRLKDRLNALPDAEIAKSNWKTYVAARPALKADDDWEYAYLPGDTEEQAELGIPRVPLLLEILHITCRVTAQRSRFMVFGTEPAWLANEFNKQEEFPLQEFTIDANARANIRLELRDSGVTESIIFPDLGGLGREIKRLWEERRLQG